MLRHSKVIPVLIALCLSIAVAAEKNKADLPLKDLIERARSADVEVRSEAAEALQARATAALDGLGGMAGFPDDDDLATLDRFRVEAKPLIPALAALFQCEHEQSRVAAALALGAIGPDAEKCRPALREVVRDKKSPRGLRLVAAPALLNVTPRNEVAGREFVELFRNAFWDDAEDGEDEGVDASMTDDESIAGWSGPFLAVLLTFADRSIAEIPSLAEAMQADSHRGVRLTAIAALAALQAEARSAIPSLRKLLNDGDAAVQKLAGLAIVWINADRAEIPGLIKAMSLGKADASEFQEEASHVLEQRANASKTIRDLGVELVPDAIRNLKHRYGYHRREAIRRLGEIGAPAKEAIPDLKLILTSDDKEARALAAEAIKAIEDAGVRR
jgi:HEAT repeat protein